MLPIDPTPFLCQFECVHLTHVSHFSCCSTAVAACLERSVCPSLAQATPCPAISLVNVLKLPTCVPLLSKPPHACLTVPKPSSLAELPNYALPCVPWVAPSMQLPNYVHSSRCLLHIPCLCVMCDAYAYMPQTRKLQKGWLAAGLRWNAGVGEQGWADQYVCVGGKMQSVTRKLQRVQRSTVEIRAK